jgi:hypothetical protein
LAYGCIISDIHLDKFDRYAKFLGKCHEFGRFVETAHGAKHPVTLLSKVNGGSATDTRVGPGNYGNGLWFRYLLIAHLLSLRAQKSA